MGTIFTSNESNYIKRALAPISIIGSYVTVQSAIVPYINPNVLQILVTLYRKNGMD